MSTARQPWTSAKQLRSKLRTRRTILRSIRTSLHTFKTSLWHSSGFEMRYAIIVGLRSCQLRRPSSIQLSLDRPVYCHRRRRQAIAVRRYLPSSRQGHLVVSGYQHCCAPRKIRANPALLLKALIRRTTSRISREETTRSYQLQPVLQSRVVS